MGRHAVAEVDWADYQADPAAYVHLPLDKLPTEPVKVKRPSAVRPLLIMFMGALLTGFLLVLLIRRLDPLGAATGLLLIATVTVSYFTAMLGMLLAHWREL